MTRTKDRLLERVEGLLRAGVDAFAHGIRDRDVDDELVTLWQERADVVLVPNLPDPVTREAYSHEVSSAGFWPGGPASPHPIFYSYAYPTPAGFAEARVRPTEASWLADLGEFVLPYDAVRTSDDPDRTLLEFLQTTYEAAAGLADWDRAALERHVDPRPGRK